MKPVQIVPLSPKSAKYKSPITLAPAQVISPPGLKIECA